MMYHYYVVYMFTTKSGLQGTANMESVLSVPIDSLDVITAIAKKVVEDEGYENVIITNFQELKRRPV